MENTQLLPTRSNRVTIIVIAHHGTSVHEKDMATCDRGGLRSVIQKISIHYFMDGYKSAFRLLQFLKLRFTYTLLLILQDNWWQKRSAL